MAKHKKVTLWVAWLDHPFKGDKKVCVKPVEAIDTGKQYRLEERIKATDYRSHINKKSNDCLFESLGSALNHLDAYYTRQEQLATARANDAQENLFLVTEALREYNKSS